MISITIKTVFPVSERPALISQGSQGRRNRKGDNVEDKEVTGGPSLIFALGFYTYKDTTYLMVEFSIQK